MQKLLRNSLAWNCSPRSSWCAEGEKRSASSKMAAARCAAVRTRSRSLRQLPSASVSRRSFSSCAHRPISYLYYCSFFLPKKGKGCVMQTSSRYRLPRSLLLLGVSPDLLKTQSTVCTVLGTYTGPSQPGPQVKD